MGCKRKSASNAGQQTQSSSTRKLTQVDCLRQALEWFAKDHHFTDLKLHGNVGWSAMQLVSLAVLWVWSDHGTLTRAFHHARSLSLAIFGDVAVKSYQGLMGALQSYTSQLLPLLWSRLHTLMEHAAGQHWRIGKWLPLAVDGSRISTPRTTSNEQAFSAKNYGRGGKAKSRIKWKNKRKRSKKLSEAVKPQVWLTLICHLGLKMPWCWKTGPSTSSERAHFMEMLQTLVFPVNALFCCDAGFVGYELWKALIDGGHHFVIRVGANVRLLRELGVVRQRGDYVYLWPDKVMRKRQPPLVLRLLEFQGARGKVCLVTNVLSERELSPKQARDLYRLRWGVELQFRTFKQTFGRGKLRSRTAENALVELDWSLVGLWLIQLFATKEQIQIDSPPEQSSAALALAVFQDAMRNWSRPVSKPREMFRNLSNATKDTYHRSRSKQARYRANYKDKPSATEPVIVRASKSQREAYQALQTAA